MLSVGSEVNLKQDCQRVAHPQRRRRVDGQILRPRLGELIMACPGKTAQMIVDALLERSQQSWSMRMDEQVRVNLTGRLGPPQRNAHEVFVPLVASQIESSVSPAPAAAVAVLIALGREVAPLMECDDPVTDELMRFLRARVVAIGKKVDALGGIQLMRSVYTAAMRFLAGEEIHVGRWVECVWDGIGQWRG